MLTQDNQDLSGRKQNSPSPSGFDIILIGAESNDFSNKNLNLTDEIINYNYMFRHKASIQTARAR